VLDYADLQAIRSLEQRWLAEEVAGNAGAVLDFCTDDVVRMPPTERALRGKAAVRAWFVEPPARIERLHLSNVRIDGDGFIAYKVADYQTRYIPDGSTDPVTSAGTHVWVLRRGADSTWRVTLVAWTFFEKQ
jgi:ketosteroid isomerase-like protein